MKRTDFFYDLPNELIAQTPLEPRDSSRMMYVSRNTGEITHSFFNNLCDYLNKGDLLILNNSKVFPARIFGIKKDTGALIQFLLLEQKEKDIWEVMVKPGRRLPIGTVVEFNDILSAEILEKADGGNRIVKFNYNGDNIFEILDKIGQMPLPHYITERLNDKKRYNTIYSKEIGSAAAPTAGLHFTENTFESIRKKGVNIAFVTLHVGLGTFRPVKAENIEDHNMHFEHYIFPQATAEAINKCKANGGRVIAVGTTSCRTLESVGRNQQGILKEEQGSTNIFIYPGYKFSVINGLITNFHLPESSLIMLVSALMGKENTMKAYKEAINEKYRFFSFGDAMFIGD